MRKASEFNLYTNVLDGRHLIEASAGTGKTFAITRLFLRLLIETELQVQNILVVTFTKAATNELKDRIHHLLLQARDILSEENRGTTDPGFITYLKKWDSPQSKKKLEDALRDFDEARIFTIDGFCHKVLLDNAFESGSLFDTELITEQTNLLQGVIYDWWRTRIDDVSPLFARYLVTKTDPEKLYKLIANRVGLKYLKIIPKGEACDCSDLERAFEDSYSRLRDTWQKSREEVKTLLSTAHGLKANTYKPAWIVTWLKEIDVYTAPVEADPGVPKSVSKLTTSNLRDGTKKGNMPPVHSFFDTCEEHHSNSCRLETAYNDRLMKLKQDLFEYARAELAKRKLDENVYFFDDLRLNLHRALESKEGERLTSSIQKQYGAALIDEFQDTDPMQYEIFNRIFANPASKLFLIGDPKQAIYGFRGADVFAYMRSRKEIPEDSLHTLTVNYRSHPGLISAINALWGAARNGRPFVYEEIKYDPATPADTSPREELILEGASSAPLQLWYVNASVYGERSIYDHKCRLKKAVAVPLIVKSVASEIGKIVRLGNEKKARLEKEVQGQTNCENIEPRHIAVLVRENQQARELQKALASIGVNSVLYSTDSLFRSAEAEELAIILKSISEPRHTGHLKTALATEIIGLSANEIFAADQDETVLEEWYGRMARYHTIWRDSGFTRMIRTAIHEMAWLKKLVAYQDGERRLTNLNHLIEVLNEAETSLRLGMSGLTEWLNAKRLSDGLMAEEHQLRLESDENAVTLMTMHMSKGLEYPIVFCPFTWAGAFIRNKKEFDFHDDDPDTSFTLELGSAEVERNLEAAREEQLAENLRLLYVALTRARHRCYFTWGLFYESRSSAPGYLLHQPQGLTGGDILKQLDRRFKELDDEALLDELGQIVDQVKTDIKLSDLPPPDDVFVRLAAPSASDFSVREFTATIDTSHRIASYSSLVADIPHGAELPDYDDREVPVKDEPDRDPGQQTGFVDFPRGTKTGIFIHGLLEEMDFTEVDDSVYVDMITTGLHRFGFEPEWEKQLLALLKCVTRTSLQAEKGTVRLLDVPVEKRLNELEFHFPLQQITPQNLREIYTEVDMSYRGPFVDRLKAVDFKTLSGFMKGFIDLVIEYDDKFYIIDWKSNYLGDTASDYRKAALVSAMAESLYFLQYDLYTLALDQYLRLRKPGYRYEEHFGGVFYIFLRGLSEEGRTGVFYDRPTLQLKEKMQKTFLPAYED